jgi:hypothetical protein
LTTSWGTQADATAPAAATPDKRRKSLRFNIFLSAIVCSSLKSHECGFCFHAKYQ